MRFAHFSDLHLLSLAGARVRDFLSKRVTGGANLLLHRGRHYRPAVFAELVEDLNRQELDQIVCTGDVTNLALPGEFELARGFFDRIALGPEHTTCIPGNHDSYARGDEGRFEDAFDAYCAPDADWAWPDGHRWPVVRVRGSLAVIALSTGIPTGWLYARGSLGKAQLERLDAVLGDARLADKFRLVLLHHPPAGRWSSHPLRGLVDRAAFRRVLSRHGAELVLHGHEHRDLEQILPGPGGTRVPVRCVPSGSYGVPGSHRRAGYRIYTLAPNGTGRPRLVRDELRALAPGGAGFAG